MKHVRCGEYEFVLEPMGFGIGEEADRQAEVCLNAAAIALQKQPRRTLRHIYGSGDLADDKFAMVQAALDTAVRKKMKAIWGRVPIGKPFPQVMIHIARGSTSEE
jgi:hypothetical protein